MPEEIGTPAAGEESAGGTTTPTPETNEGAETPVTEEVEEKVVNETGREVNTATQSIENIEDLPYKATLMHGTSNSWYAEPAEEAPVEEENGEQMTL